MTRLTAIEIATNYPDNLLIIGRQEKKQKMDFPVIYDQGGSNS